MLALKNLARKGSIEAVYITTWDCLFTNHSIVLIKTFCIKHWLIIGFGFSVQL